MHKVNENSIQKVHKENINTIVIYIQSNKKEASQKRDALMNLQYFSEIIRIYFDQ